MIDQGAAYTDKELAKMEKKIKQIYSEAQSDIEDKIAEFNKKFYAKQSLYQQKLKDGEITQEQYDQWLRGQVFQSKQWESKKDQIIGIIQNANKEAANILNGGTISVFAENANWSHYQMEQSRGVNFGFGLYDAQTVTNLIKNDPQVLPKWKINEPKDYVWNSKKVNNSITQGIIQGEGLDKIAKRLANSLSSNNRNTMLTFARTAMTGAQNAGRYQSQQDAKELGIDIVKVWMSTLDKHTRVSHQELDGEEQKVGDKWYPYKFSNGCRYPGDPQGPPHEVYNCRCTLVSDIKDYPSKFNRYDNIDGKVIGNMTYKEWKQAKLTEERTPPVSIRPEVVREVVEGTDISGTWVRRSEQFTLEIDDIINAQGFDGLPKVVSPDEFEKAVEENGIICKRGYTAPNEETLEKYREELYNGKWYVDCSKGGAAFGQGMYSFGEYGTKLTEQSEIGVKGYGSQINGRIEAFTLKNPKIINYDDIKSERSKIFYNIYVNSIDSKLNDKQKTLMKLMTGYPMPDEIRNDYSLLSDTENVKYVSQLLADVTKKEDVKSKIDSMMRMNDGAFSTLLGYDAIEVDVGRNEKYFIVLNRTKCIFKGDG